MTDTAEAQGAPTPEERARKIVRDVGLRDPAAAPEMVAAIAQAIREAEAAAYERGRADEREVFLRPLGYDAKGKDVYQDGTTDAALINLYGAIADLERSSSDKVSLDTLKRVYGQLDEAVAIIRARGGSDG
jgi:hypothetical protein